jgi:hypothetical protein
MTTTVTSNHNSTTTTFVYVKSKEHAWLPAQIVEGSNDEGGGTVTVNVSLPRSDVRSRQETQMTVSLKDYPHASLPLQNIDPSTGQLRVVADLADLSFLHEVRVGENCLYQLPFGDCASSCCFVPTRLLFYTISSIVTVSQNNPTQGLERTGPL